VGSLGRKGTAEISSMGHLEEKNRRLGESLMVLFEPSGRGNGRGSHGSTQRETRGRTSYGVRVIMNLSRKRGKEEKIAKAFKPLEGPLRVGDQV